MLASLIVVLIFIAGLSPILWRFYVQHRWVPARGTIVDNTVYPQASKGKAARYRYPSVEFSAKGETHIFESRWRKRASAPPRFRVGDVVDILYSPRKPTRAIIRTWGRYLRWAAMIEICIVVIFMAPLMLAVLSGNK